MDQRGTGKSSPVSSARLASWVASHGEDVVADFMTCFRADSIVRDAEVVRKRLFGDQPWSVLGQSFGGFCAVHYLSYVAGSVSGSIADAPPCPLSKVFITGGLPRIEPSPNNALDVYRACLQRITAASASFFKQYPVNLCRVQALAQMLETQADGGSGDADTPLSHDSRFITLSDGSRFTMRRLASYGLVLGLSSGSTSLHNLLECAFTCRGLPASSAQVDEHTDASKSPPATQHAFSAFGESAPAHATQQAALEVPDVRHNERFATMFRDANGMVANVMYWLMHESIYAQGSGSNWAAQAALDEHEAKHKVTARAFQFYGEMVFPWLADDCPEFTPLAGVAERLARRSDWPALYDVQALGANTVPTVATVYTQDAFVPVDMSTSTASKIGCCRVVLNETAQHDGLHVHSADVWGGMLAADRSDSTASPPAASDGGADKSA